MNKKRLLITGATGFLGFRTTEYLEKETDIEFILAAGRVLKVGAIVKSKKVKYLLGDLTNQAYVQSLFTEGISHIVHCAALAAPWGPHQDFHEANVRSTKHLIQQARKNQIERFIYISTPSIYFNYKHRWNIKESEALPQAFVNHYATSKRAAELLLESSGLNFISLRPRALIGRGDSVIMPRIIRAVKEGKLKIIGDGKNKVDLTSVGNVAHAIRLSLDAPETALNQHFNISNGKPVLLWESINRVLEKLGLILPEKRIPYKVAKIVAYLMEKKAQLFQEDEPVLTRYSVGTLAMNFTMDITKAKKLLGYQPLTTIEESLNEFVEWYKKTQDVQT